MEENAINGGLGTGAANSAMGTDNQTGQEKTYTQAEFDKALMSEADKRVNQALENKRSEWEAEYKERLQAEKDEAARLAKMSAEERKSAEFEQKVKDFEAKEAAYQAERLEFECVKQLAEKKLPTEFSGMLTGKDADVTKANIESFEKQFNKAIEAAVNERLKGSTPKTTTTNTETDSFLSGFKRK